MMSPQQWLLALAGCIVTSSSPAAAEVSGTVSVAHQGLFKVADSVENHPISVILLPRDGHPRKLRAPLVQRIEIAENRMRPAFLTIATGDPVKFVNHDPVSHQLFSLLPSDPLSAQLAKAGSAGVTSITMRFDQPGTTTVCCRTHNDSYAPVDVVDTPYLQTIQPGEHYHFARRGPGGWRLRRASRGAGTQWVDAIALTAPPARRFSLDSRGGGTGSVRHAGQTPVAHLCRH